MCMPKCLSLVLTSYTLLMKAIYPQPLMPNFWQALVSLRITVFAPHRLSSGGGHIVETGRMTSSLCVMGETCPMLEYCVLLGGCGG